MNDSTKELILPDYPHGYDISTERLKLRVAVSSDSNELWPLVSDPLLTTFLAWEPHKSHSETEHMIAALAQSHEQGKAFHWVAVHSGKIVGLLSFIDVRRTHRSWLLNRAELAYWIAVPYQGCGYATEAAMAILRFGFERLGFHKVVVYHASDNPASGRTIQKLGFRFVGEELEAFSKAGTWHHLKQFEMIESEYSKSSLKQI